MKQVLRPSPSLLCSWATSIVCKTTTSVTTQTGCAKTPSCILLRGTSFEPCAIPGGCTMPKTCMPLAPRAPCTGKASVLRASCLGVTRTGITGEAAGPRILAFGLIISSSTLRSVPVAAWYRCRCYGVSSPGLHVVMLASIHRLSDALDRRVAPALTVCLRARWRTGWTRQAWTDGQEDTLRPQTMRPCGLASALPIQQFLGMTKSWDKTK